MRQSRSSPSSVTHRGGAGDGTLIEGERSGVHGVAVLEVEEQPVATFGASARHRSGRRRRRSRQGGRGRTPGRRIASRPGGRTHRDTAAGRSPGRRPCAPSSRLGPRRRRQSGSTTADVVAVDGRGRPWFGAARWAGRCRRPTGRRRAPAAGRPSPRSPRRHDTSRPAAQAGRSTTCRLRRAMGGGGGRPVSSRLTRMKWSFFSWTSVKSRTGDPSGPSTTNWNAAAVRREHRPGGHEPVALCGRDDSFADRGGCHRFFDGRGRTEDGAGTQADAEHRGDDDRERSKSWCGVHHVTSCAVVAMIIGSPQPSSRQPMLYPMGVSTQPRSRSGPAAQSLQRGLSGRPGRRPPSPRCR